MDGSRDTVEQVSADDDVCQLEGHGAGVPNDTSPSLDGTRLHAREWPGGDLLRQLGGQKERAKVVGQGM